MNLLIEHDAVLKCAHGLPPLPQSAARLACMLTNDDVDLREIVKVIEYDPTLTMKLLRLANSAYYGSAHHIGTVRQALLRLGTKTVASLAMAASVRPLMGKRILGYNIREREFWTHSLAAAFAAESIQAHSSNWSGLLAFTAGLLHDTGKLVLGQFLNAELSEWLHRAVTEGRRSVFQAEREILSLHHGEAGGIIAQHWGLPDELVKGVTYHHCPEEGADGICDVTYLANLVAHRLESESGTDERSPSEWLPDDAGPTLERLGLAEKDLISVCADACKGLHAVAGQF